MRIGERWGALKFAVLSKLGRNAHPESDKRVESAAHSKMEQLTHTEVSRASEHKIRPANETGRMQRLIQAIKRLARKLTGKNEETDAMDDLMQKLSQDSITEARSFALQKDLSRHVASSSLKNSNRTLKKAVKLLSSSKLQAQRKATLESCVAALSKPEKMNRAEISENVTRMLNLYQIALNRGDEETRERITNFLNGQVYVPVEDEKAEDASGIEVQTRSHLLEKLSNPIAANQLAKWKEMSPPHKLNPAWF